jgi:hypothetical protein
MPMNAIALLNVEVVMVMTFLLTVFAAVASTFVPAVDRRLAEGDRTALFLSGIRLPQKGSPARRAGEPVGGLPFVVRSVAHPAPAPSPRSPHLRVTGAIRVRIREGRSCREKGEPVPEEGAVGEESVTMEKRAVSKERAMTEERVVADNPWPTNGRPNPMLLHLLGDAPQPLSGKLGSSLS